MAISIAEIETRAANPDPNTDNHILRLSPFGGGPVNIGPLAVAKVNGVMSYTTLRASQQDFSVLDGPITTALHSIELTRDEAEDLRRFITGGKAFPKVPIRKVPE